MAQRPPRREAAPDLAPRADRRLRAWVLAVLVVLSLFGGRLVQLQGTDATALAAEALETRQTDELTLHADRGDIVDANGVQLATSVERRDVVVDPSVLRWFNMRSATNPAPVREDRGVGPAGAAKLLAEVLDLDEAELTDRITTEDPQDRYEVIAKGLSPEVWRKVQALKIPGIASERASHRVYATGPAASTPVGVLGPGEGPDGRTTTRGVSGLKAFLEDRLRGRDGWEV